MPGSSEIWQQSDCTSARRRKADYLQPFSPTPPCTAKGPPSDLKGCVMSSAARPSTCAATTLIEL